MRSLLCLSLFASILAATTSCKKATETITNIVRDTVRVQAADTTLPLTTNDWALYSQDVNAVVAPGSNTYFTTAEGLKFLAQGVRRGARLQTKNELGFANKVMYIKWKANAAGQFVQVLLQVKYDPTTPDMTTPPAQGVDFTVFVMTSPFNNYPVIQSDTWYYTRIKHVIGTDNYLVITSTNNYDNAGGNVFQSTSIPVYTKHGYLTLRLGDNYGGSAQSLTLAEYRIQSN